MRNPLAVRFPYFFVHVLLFNHCLYVPMPPHAAEYLICKSPDSGNASWYTYTGKTFTIDKCKPMSYIMS